MFLSPRKILDAGTLIIALVLFQHLGVLADVPHSTDLKSYQNGVEQPMQGFYSAPHIKAPIWQVNKFDYDKTDKAGRFLFCTGNYSGKFGPSIYSAKDLSLVYSGENYDNVVRAFTPRMFKGQHTLVAWAGWGVSIWNQNYKLLYATKPQGPEGVVSYDPHEATTTDDDTVIVLHERLKAANLSSKGGDEQGFIYDNWFQEIDPVTNEVRFEFAVADHFNLSDSIWPLRHYGVWNLGTGKAFDFSHINSVEKV